MENRGSIHLSMVQPLSLDSLGRAVLGDIATTGTVKHPTELAWEGTYHCAVSYEICLWDEDSERPCPTELFDAFCLC